VQKRCNFQMGSLLDRYRWQQRAPRCAARFHASTVRVSTFHFMEREASFSSSVCCDFGSILLGLAAGRTLIATRVERLGSLVGRTREALPLTMLQIVTAPCSTQLV
jgi:hypothetical protein